MMAVFASWAGFPTALLDPELEARNTVSKEPNNKISFCRVFPDPDPEWATGVRTKVNMLITKLKEIFTVDGY
jgi:hypothetical protein